MHLFTIIQILCLGFLWGIKESPAALSLPLMIFLLVPFRYFVLPFWFKPLELAAVSHLDAQLGACINTVTLANSFFHVQLDADGVEICDPKEITFSIDEYAEGQAYENAKRMSQGMNGKPEMPIQNGKVPLQT